MLRYFLLLVESYLFIAIASIALGLSFPETFSRLGPHATLLLQTIFFLSSLKLETSELFHAGKQWRTLLAVNAMILIVLPVAVYATASVLVPELAFALTLLAAMPAGMTLPLMAEVIDGDRSLALLLTVTSSLLAPLTVPLVLSRLASANVALPIAEMAWRLFVVIVIPFVIAQIVRRALPVFLPKNARVMKPISLALLGALIAASVARNAGAIRGAETDLGMILFVLAVFFVSIHLFSHLVFHRKPYREQVTIAASITFMNFTLAIYLTGQYAFPPSVPLTLALSIIPWAVLLIPFKHGTDLLRRHGWIS